MSYSDETARTAKQTANGTQYVQLTITPFGASDTMLLCVPTVTTGVLMICAHGHNGSEETINNPQMITTRDQALDQGWLVASSYAHGNAWSNDTALDDYRRVYDWVESMFTITDVLLHGQSMGGLTVMNLTAKDAIPDVRATVSIDGALNLASAYASGSYKAAITAAYGIAANGSDYAQKTADHDAVLQPVAAYKDKRLLIESSPADTSIPKATNSDVFYQNYMGYPSLLTTFSGAGTHVAAENYFPDDVMAFFRSAIGKIESPVAKHKVEKMWMKSGPSLVQVTDYTQPVAVPETTISISSLTHGQDVTGTVPLKLNINATGTVSRAWFQLGTIERDAARVGTTTEWAAAEWDTTKKLRDGTGSPSNYRCWIKGFVTVDGTTYSTDLIYVETANYSYGTLPAGGWRSNLAWGATYTTKEAWLDSYPKKSDGKTPPTYTPLVYGSAYADVVDDPTLGPARKVMKVSLPDTARLDAEQPTNSPRFQAQSPSTFYEGDEFYVGFSIYVPTSSSSAVGANGFPVVNVSSTEEPTSQHIAIFQMYGPQATTPDYPDGRGAITIIDTNRRTSSDPGAMFHIESNQLNGGDPGFLVEFPYNRGAWTDIVLGFHMSADIKRGWIEVYLNQGQYTSVQPVQLFGGTYRLPRVSAWPASPSPALPTAYDKQGNVVQSTGGSKRHRTDMQIYRSPTAYPSVTLYHTGHKIGPTAASVDPKSYV